MTTLAVHLFEAGCIKFGDFTLKSGLHSPIYIDLRLLVSYPSIMEEVAKAIAESTEHCEYDRIAAIPYAGLPIGVAMSLAIDCPLVYPRREVKQYGTRRVIEGMFRKGEQVLVVDDLITRGDSKSEAIGPLQAAGLFVHDIAVLIDREQGGADVLTQRGYELHAVFKLSELLAELNRSGHVPDHQIAEVLRYIGRQ